VLLALIEGRSELAQTLALLAIAQQLDRQATAHSSCNCNKETT
jgi:hypothetical protein